MQKCLNYSLVRKKIEKENVKDLKKIFTAIYQQYYAYFISRRLTGPKCFALTMCDQKILSLVYRPVLYQDKCHYLIIKIKFQRCYQMIDRRLRKNLQGLYLVHPTFWVKTVVVMTRPFVRYLFKLKIKIKSGCVCALCLRYPARENPWIYYYYY